MGAALKQAWRDNEVFEDLIHTCLQGDGVTVAEVTGFLAMLWDQARPDEKPFKAQPAETRLAWSMPFLKKLVKMERISRAKAFRVLEEL